MTAIVIASAITYGSMMTLINICDVLAFVSSFVVRSALPHPPNDVGFLRELILLLCFPLICERLLRLGAHWQLFDCLRGFDASRMQYLGFFVDSRVSVARL